MAPDAQDKLRNDIAELKEHVRRLREAATSLEELTGGPIRHHYPVDLWSLSDSELDGEMGKRLGFLNEDIDSRPTPAIASHRRVIGPLIVFFKKLLLRVLRPYSNTLFTRQVRFNEQLVAFHLATFIRLRRQQERIERLQREIQEALDRLDDMPGGGGDPAPGDE
ncbi:MAG: hypothetical protein JXO51_10335 [Candidatus Aminicenantes bacterium]|nr:hypothetical protein [Candidatus Aminicenantes bacterium]